MSSRQWSVGACTKGISCLGWQYPGSAFKVAALDKWIVFVSGRKMIEELRKRGDEELSFKGTQEARVLSFPEASITPD